MKFSLDRDVVLPGPVGPARADCRKLRPGTTNEFWLNELVAEVERPRRAPNSHEFGYNLIETQNKVSSLYS